MMNFYDFIKLFIYYKLSNIIFLYNIIKKEIRIVHYIFTLLISIWNLNIFLYKFKVQYIVKNCYINRILIEL